MKEKSLEEKIQRALDYQEIQNVMARHCYYHSAGKHEEEMDRIWAKKTPGARWSTTSGVRDGYDSIRRSYVENRKPRQAKALEALRKWFPDVEDKEENYGMGSLVIHTLTTPVIEIAGDGNTVKGVWYSPGIVTEIGKGGRPIGRWMWEKYGVDFVKEDGEWKIWHIHMYYDIACLPGQSWTDLDDGTEFKIAMSEAPQVPFDQPCPPEQIYERYSLRTVPKLVPRPPEPYETFDEKTAY